MLQNDTTAKQREKVNWKAQFVCIMHNIEEYYKFITLEYVMFPFSI